MAKKKIDPISTFISKKYNQDTDVVPIHPTGFSLSANDRDNLTILEFFFASTKNGKKQRIELGSYVLSSHMAEELAELLQKDLRKDENKEIE